MKVYEKLGFDTEAAIKWVELCERKKCADCPAKRDDETICTAKCAADYLLSEVQEPPKVQRWQTIKSQADMDKVKCDFDKYCSWNTCVMCQYYVHHGGNFRHCFYFYLSELVEAPEVEE